MHITADYITELAHDMASAEGTTVPADFDAEAIVREVFATPFITGRGWSHLSSFEQDEARIEHYGTACLVEVSRALGI